MTQVIITMALYLGATSTSVWLDEHFSLPQWGKISILLTPIVPMFFYLRALIQFYLGVDEMSRRIQAEAAGIAGIATALVCVAVGSLERAGVSQMNGLWIFAILFISFAIAEFLLRRRYR